MVTTVGGIRKGSPLSSKKRELEALERNLKKQEGFRVEFED
jgi:hypothetical protein